LSETYLGSRTPSDSSDFFTAISFIAKQMRDQAWTCTLVKVMAVYGGGVGSPGQVDVQPCVNQINGFGQPTPHDKISKLPFGRIQFGTSAFICDPAVGDIGLACFGSHDHTAVLNTGDIASPGSYRRFDPSDGIYVISLIGQTPTTFIQLLPDGGIQITVPAGKPLNLQADTVVITGDLQVSGDVVAGGSGGVSLETHVHSGVQTGGGDTGPPT
jgi:hypothetical protein